MKKETLTYILLLLILINYISMMILVKGDQVKNKISSFGTIDYSTTSPSVPIMDSWPHPLHGVAIPFGTADRLGEEDLNRFVRWGLNAVCINLWWTGTIEKNEGLPGEYDENNLKKLETAISKLEDVGLKVILSGRVCHNPDDPEYWEGWSAIRGHNYVNLNELDSSGSRGRERYGDWLAYMAERFPSCGISLWHFPYHMQGASDSERETLHEVTLPYLYNRVRNVSDQPIIVNPIHQGSGGDWVTGQTTWFYRDAEKYGWPFVEDPMLIYGFSNHEKKINTDVMVNGKYEWDYDYSYVDHQYEGLEGFQDRHPRVKFCCVESIALRSGSESIEQSRLDLAEAHFSKMEELDLGWFYHRYDSPPKTESPYESDGSDNEVAKLIEKYS